MQVPQNLNIFVGHKKKCSSGLWMSVLYNTRLLAPVLLLRCTTPLRSSSLFSKGKELQWFIKLGLSWTQNPTWASRGEKNL